MSKVIIEKAPPVCTSSSASLDNVSTTLSPTCACSGWSCYRFLEISVDAKELFDISVTLDTKLINISPVSPTSPSAGLAKLGVNPRGRISFTGFRIHTRLALLQSAALKCACYTCNVWFKVSARNSLVSAISSTGADMCIHIAREIHGIYILV